MFSIYKGSDLRSETAYKSLYLYSLAQCLEHSRLSKKFIEWVVAVEILLSNPQMPKKCSVHTNKVRFLCWQSSRALQFSLGYPASWLTFRVFLGTLLIPLGSLLDRGPPFSELSLVQTIHTYTYLYTLLLKIRVFCERQLILFSVLAEVMLSFKDKWQLAFT